MSDYHQPDFYKFNEDSLELVKYIRGKIIRAQNILDAGAGCGIMGMELARGLKAHHLTLLELQEDYAPFIERNLREKPPGQTEVEVVYSSFGDFKITMSYDLIVCNPPYYLPGHGEPSASPQRDLARTFKKDGWRTLLEMTKNALTTHGRAFFVVKNNKLIHQEIHHYLPIGVKVSEEVHGGLVFLELVRLDEN